MRFAITLLSVICIASVIGTVLKQQEPYNNYVNQFGPFWAQIFDRFGLFHVYSVWWFLLILAFLVLSTTLCISRNAPKILRDLKNYKEHIPVRSMSAFAHKAQADLPTPPQEAIKLLAATLQARGWKLKAEKRIAGTAEDSAGIMLAAKKGTANKLGYIAAHSAIVLICLGGLMDGDLLLRAQTWWGNKVPFRGGGGIAEVPPQHWLSSNNPSYRGNLLVAEGETSSTAVLSQPEGVLLQPLPFGVELKKFTIDFYSTGMPKLFASDIIVHDKETGAKIPARVEVNHPYHYKGVAIYQSSFEDGGSQLTLRAQPMDANTSTFEVQGRVGGSTDLSNSKEQLKLEYTGLRVFNIENMAPNEGNRESVLGVRENIEKHLGAGNKTATQKALRNVGPSVSYKLRDAAGQAKEYNNYMQPVAMEEGANPVFLLGVRTSPAEPFRYLRIPADEKNSMDGFFALRRALQQPAARALAAQRYARTGAGQRDAKTVSDLETTAARTLALFAGQESKTGVQGLEALGEFLESNVPKNEREKAGALLVTVLQGALAELYAGQAGQNTLTTDGQRRFAAQAILGLSDVASYPAPMAFMLKEFQQVQASVFQVTRSPGRNVVYLGCVLLMLGVFAMLYVRERRIWLWLEPSAAQGSHVRMAYSSNRQTLHSEDEFTELRKILLATPPEPPSALPLPQERP